jgi:uncharacterized protein
MLRMIEDRMVVLISLCVRYRVLRLEVFGSAARDETFDTVASDLDFLVEFQDLAEGQHADAYFGLLEELQDLFQRPVDLVMTRAIKNPYFLQAIEGDRKVLYAA